MDTLKAWLQYQMDNMQLAFDMKEFFFSIIGFLLFQFLAFILAGYAQAHSKY
jgi:hypothetical protein